MILEALPQVQRLSKPEKMLLANELWEELAGDATEMPLTKEQVVELDRRMEHYRQHPEDVTTWEEIKARLKQRKPSGE